MESIGPITNAIIDALVAELKKKETRDKIYLDMIEPFIDNIICKYHSYFTLLVILLFAIVILLVMSIYYAQQNMLEK
jgi:hypothetical protein